MITRARIFLEQDDGTEQIILLDRPGAGELFWEGDDRRISLTIRFGHAQVATIPWSDR